MPPAPSPRRRWPGQMPNKGGRRHRSKRLPWPVRRQRICHGRAPVTSSQSRPIPTRKRRSRNFRQILCQNPVT
eukprot:2673091-Pleurochrysis_carterae.AAC.1